MLVFNALYSSMDEFVDCEERYSYKIFFVSSEAQPENSQTLWEYKWKNADEEAIHGPFSSEQMNEWVQQEFFKEGVFVRKAGAVDAPFYTSKRVDFDLYT